MTGFAIRRLLPLAALLLPAPALADVTATYTLRGSAPLAVEVDDGGNSRAGVEGRFALIRRDGVDYLVVFRDGKPNVTRADAALAKFAQGAPQTSKWQTELAEEGSATIAGYAGTVWHFGPADEPALELVMSPDPALAPVGQIFYRVSTAFAEVIAARAGPGNDAVAGVQALFGHGTPLRVREPAVEPAPGKVLIELQSVSRAEIDSRRFDLPGPVMTAEAFFAAITPPQPPVVDEPMIVPDGPPAEPSRPKR